MLEYLNMLNVPARIVIIVVLILVVSQIIGSIASIKGAVVPEILTIRKALKQRKKNRETIDKLPENLDIIVKSIGGLAIQMNEVKEMAIHTKEELAETQRKLDLNTNLTEETRSRVNEIEKEQIKDRIETMRTRYLNFSASCVQRDHTRETYNKMQKIYEEYEALIEAQHLSNHEMDVSHQIIMAEWDRRIKEHDFLDDKLGYPR